VDLLLQRRDNISWYLNQEEWKAIFFHLSCLFRLEEQLELVSRFRKK
jgi:hypothetical protein